MLEAKFSLPDATCIDGRLVTGAALFGAGWGLAGMCPGANLAGLAGGGLASVLFFGFWVAGMFLGKFFERAVVAPLTSESGQLGIWPNGAPPTSRS